MGEGLPFERPLYPDAPVPTWREFVRDYPDSFFQDAKKNTGRCFIILAGREEVGTIGYDLLNRAKRWVGFDIWLKGEEACGHGYGTEALRLLSEHLNETEGIRYFYISPSLRKMRAVKAYEKAGFVKLKMVRYKAKKKFGLDVFDCDDNVIMRMTMRVSGG
jgi:diamine N-acetyltransferase